MGGARGDQDVAPEQRPVLGVDVECTSPFGTFECLHLKRTRTAGGAAVKEFWYARGVGKVKETGDNQTELLTDCGT